MRGIVVRLLDARSAGMALGFGLVLTLWTVLVSSTEFVHASRWDPDVAPHSSQYIEVKVWGWPLYWAMDNPVEGRRNRIHAASELIGWRVAVDVAFGALLLLYARGLLVVRRARQRPAQPLTAALLAPMTVFLVVQLLLPVVELGSGSAFGRSFLSASFVATLAAAAALLVMLVFGFAVAWLLRRLSWFTPAGVFVTGALIALLPVAGDLFSIQRIDPFTIGLPLIVALAGGGCALTFRELSGLGRSEPEGSRGRPALVRDPG